MDTKFICVGKQPKVRHEVSAIFCSLFQADLQDTSSSIYTYIYFWARNKPKYRYPYSQTEIEMRTLTPTHTRQQKTIFEASPIFPLRIAVGPNKNARPRLTTWGYVRVFPHAPTLAHCGACHREARDGICTRPTAHTLGSRPKCVGVCRATQQLLIPQQPLRQAVHSDKLGLTRLTETTTPCVIAPPAMNPQNLRTLTHQLEVRTPVAKDIWGKS